ncbi:MAG: MATE family efflux transporter [Waddliaceae bacterium]
MSLEVRDGSVKTLWSISFPLILSFLSMLGMVTVDRLFLARYSTEALSAAVSGGTAAWAFAFGGQTLTNISGVFVAQYNGAKKYDKIARPVWQMIWLSLALIIPFGIVAIWFAPLAFAGSPIEAKQILYFRWSMATSPLICLLGGLNGFFIGMGKTFVITWLTLFGNAVNLVLDPIFIFGWGPFPGLGISGACIATGIGTLAQNIILLALFLKKDSRKKYGSGNFALHRETLWNMIRIGSPEALAISLELGAWAAFYCLLSNLSSQHILVAGVGQSLLMTFFFFGIGLESGIASVCGNLIGANLKDEVVRAFQSGMKIVALFAIGLLAVIWLGREWSVSLFLTNPENLEGGTLNPDQLAEAREYVMQGCLVIGAYIVIENIRCLLYGVLRAAGDTLFILLLSVIATWALLLVPTYLLMTVWKMPAGTSFWIWLSYAISTTAICYLRFAAGSWRKKEILSAQENF